MTDTPAKIRVKRLRAIAEQYRRDANIMDRRAWWMRLLFIHPDYRLGEVMRATADEFDEKADRAEAGQ